MKVSVASPPVGIIGLGSSPLRESSSQNFGSDDRFGYSDLPVYSHYLKYRFLGPIDIPFVGGAPSPILHVKN